MPAARHVMDRLIVTAEAARRDIHYRLTWKRIGGEDVFRVVEKVI